MTNRERAEALRLRQRALSRWDNEGGAGPSGPQIHALPGEETEPAFSVGPVEWIELRTRVIALENLVIALLATASDEQRKLAREMAAYISPRPGFTEHHLTIRAAGRMVDLVERAEHFRGGQASPKDLP